MRDNITLIGMPGCGKSSTGAVLARNLGMAYLDSDREIERRCGMPLSGILRQYGDAELRRIEEEVNATLDVHGTVIAPGGSVIYGPRAMAHLREISRVIYLRLRYDTMAARLGDLRARGVTMRPGQTLLELYNERCPLYERYAHVIVDCDDLRLYGTAEEIQRRLSEAEASY